MAQRRGEEVERCKSVSTIQRMIGGKWKIEILFYIALKDVRHFGQLRRCIGNISESTLSKQLRELVADGFLTRTDFGEVPPAGGIRPHPARRKLRAHSPRSEAMGRKGAGALNGQSELSEQLGRLLFNTIPVYSF